MHAPAALGIFPPVEIDFVAPDELLGDSNPRRVVAVNGKTYIAKGPSWAPEHPLVAANELIAAQLARALNVPVLGFDVLSMEGELFFGSEWMPNGTYDRLTRTLYLQCANRHIIYQIVALDVWLINDDRHENNLLVRLTHQRGADPRHDLLANDHGRCLVQPTHRPSGLSDLVDAPLDCNRRHLWVQIHYVRDDITDRDQMLGAVTKIQDLSDEFLDQVIGAVPEGLIDSSDRAIYADFIKDRRDRLRRIFEVKSELLPNLDF